MSVVGDAGEMPAQLNRSGELTALVEGGTDRRGILLGDDEHRLSMGAQAAPDKRRLVGTREASALVCTPAGPLSK
jgi:hypothetical protein